MSLAEAGAALGDETFAIREQAEHVIRNAGMDDYDRILQLSQSANPEVATRARLCLPIVLLAIDERIPPPLAAKLRRIDGFRGAELAPIVSELAALKPPPLMTLAGLHSYWQTVRPANREQTWELMSMLEKSLPAALRGDTALAVVRRMRPELYQTPTLAIVLNRLCQAQPQALPAMLALHEAWTGVHPQLLGLLNADGYRLELCRATGAAPDRPAALRSLLEMGAKEVLSAVQAEAVRRQLAEYRAEASALPIGSLDRRTGWYFFSVLAADEDGQPHLDAYREFRQRFPNISEAALLGQPLEVLLVLDQSGPTAAMDYALKQKVHGGVVMLAEWLHARPGLIREPLPLPEVKAQNGYPYRVLKFFRVFAPYASDAEMRNHPAIAGACDILTQDPGWQEVAKQARAVIAKERADKK